MGSFHLCFSKGILLGYRYAESVFHGQSWKTPRDLNTLGWTVAVRLKVWRDPVSNEIIIICLDAKPEFWGSNCVTRPPRHAHHLANVLNETERNLLKNPILRSIGIPRGGAWCRHTYPGDRT